MNKHQGDNSSNNEKKKTLARGNAERDARTTAHECDFLMEIQFTDDKGPSCQADALIPSIASPLELPIS